MNELVEACKDGRLSDVERLLEDRDAPLDAGQKDEVGWSPLHYASQRGHLPVVEYLLRKGCDPSCEATQDRTTPLHLACANDRVDVALRLLESLPHGAPLRRTRDGNTPLHLACKLGNVTTVRALLERSRPTEAYSVTNHHGNTAFGTALASSSLGSAGAHLEVANLLLDGVLGNPARQIRDFQSLFPAIRPRHSLDRPVKIFALGEPQSGKSTLIKALQGESAAQQFRGYSLVNVPGVGNHKVGMIPTDFTSRLLNCRVTLYDLTSSRDFIHEDLIQSAEELATSIFIVCVDMKEDRKDIAESMCYWMSFVHRQCAKHYTTQCKPSVAIVGSFWDVPRLFSLVPAQRLHLEYNEMVREVEFSSRFNLLRKYSLDCRKEGSIQINQLRSALKRQCQSVQRSVDDSTPSRWYILSTVLETEFPNSAAIQLRQLKAKVSKGASQNNLLALLPQTSEELLQLCQHLEERERVLLVLPRQSHGIESTWIVHRSYQLLTQIDAVLVGVVAGSSELTGSPAIMTKDDLRECLSSIPLDFETLFHLMGHFWMYEAITTPSQHQLCFIPGLLPKKHEVLSWERDASYHLKFAWAMTPVARLEFFMPRFLKFSLLHLLTFVTAAEFEACHVWSEGIHFSSNQGAVDVCVMVSRKAVVLNLRCKVNHEIDCLTYRNQVLHQIRESKEMYQPQIKTNEFIVISTSRAKFPLRDVHSRRLTKIDIEEFKKELLESPDLANNSLPFFEPYLYLCKLPDAQRHALTSPSRTSQLSVTASLMQCFGKEWWKDLMDHFEFPQVDSDPDTSSSTGHGSGSALNEKSEDNLGDVTDCSYVMECLASISIFEGPSLSEALCGSSLAWKPSADSLHLSPHPSPPLSTGSALMGSRSFPPLPTSSTSSSKSSGLNSYTPQSDTDPIPVLPSSSSIASHSSFDVVAPDPSPVPAERNLPHSLKITQHSSPVVPFMDTVQVVHCDSTGGRFTYEPHDVTLSVPEGAANPSLVANVEVGVTLKGPLLFPKDIKPLSPVVMLRLQEDSTLVKAVELAFPHCYRYTQEDQHMLTLLKAGKPTPGGKIVFRKTSGTVGRGKGTVWIKPSNSLPCFFCIGCKMTPEAVAKTNYCVIKVMPRSTDESTWQLVLCVSYLLQTSIEMVRRQFGEEYMASYQPFMFEAAEDREPFVAIHFERFQATRWSLTVDGTNQIAAHEVDFSVEDSQALFDSSLYPPRFNLIVNGERATEDHVAVITFSGTQRLLQMEVALLLQGACSVGGHFRNASISSVGSFDQEDPFRPHHCQHWPRHNVAGTGKHRNPSISSTKSGFSSSSGGAGLTVSIPRTVASVQAVSPSGQTMSPVPQGTLVPGQHGWAPPEFYRTTSHWSIASNISEPAFTWNTSPPHNHTTSMHPVIMRNRVYPCSQTSPKLEATDTDMISTILERHLVIITENLQMDVVRPYLRQHKVLTKAEHMELVKYPHAELLVDILERKGDEGTRRFISMLKATSGKAPGHSVILQDLSQDEHCSLIVSEGPAANAGHSSHIFRFASRLSIN